MNATNDNPSFWFVPCNVKLFDVVEHLKENDKLTVKQGRKVAAGDYVYLYVGKPYSRILYRCIVKEAGVHTGDLAESEKYAISKGARPTPYMRLCVDIRFDELKLSYSDLLENGMGTVQAQQAMPKKTVAYISKFE